jgi:hypothetical protein
MKDLQEGFKNFLLFTYHFVVIREISTSAGFKVKSPHLLYLLLSIIVIVRIKCKVVPVL